MPKVKKAPKEYLTPEAFSDAQKAYDREAVMERLADFMARGYSMDKACAQPDMPMPETIYKWIINDDGLYVKFMKAQTLWCLHQREVILAIAEDQSRDVLIDEVDLGNGVIKKVKKSDNTAVNRDKLRIGTRQWCMSRLYPKLFGDKIQQELSGKDGAAIMPIFNVTIKQVPNGQLLLPEPDEDQ